MNNRDQFEIRLNSVFAAIQQSDQEFALELYNEIRERMDDTILGNEDNENVRILEYNPENHDYFVSQFRTYCNTFNASQADKYMKLLYPDYGVRRHCFKDGEKDQIKLQLLQLYPNNDQISLGEGAYDILDYRSSSFELRYSEDLDDKQNFTFFFAWALGLVKESVVDDFLEFHIAHNFNDDIQKYSRFINNVCTIYNQRIINQTRYDLINGWIDKLSKSSVNDVDSTSSEVRRSGPRSKEKLEIPITVTRAADDALTRLTGEETVNLAKYLQDVGVFLKQDLVSDQSVAKALSVLTGYSHKNLGDLLGASRPSSQMRRKIKKALVEILQLIDKELGIETPGSY